MSHILIWYFQITLLHRHLSKWRCKFIYVALIRSTVRGFKSDTSMIEILYIIIFFQLPWIQVNNATTSFILNSSNSHHNISIKQVVPNFPESVFLMSRKRNYLFLLFSLGRFSFPRFYILYFIKKDGVTPNFLVKQRVKYLGSLKPTLKAICATLRLASFLSNISLAISRR